MGRCVLQIPIPQAALIPCCLHHKQTSQGPVKDSGEDGLDSVIVRFQQIIRPKEWRVKRPSIKATKRKGVKGPSHPSKRSYEPFTLSTQGDMGQGCGAETWHKNKETQLNGGEACSVSLKPEVRGSEGKDRTEDGNMPTLVSPRCDGTKGVEWKDVPVGEEGKLTLGSHTSKSGTCTEQIRTHSLRNTVHEVLQGKETNVMMDSAPDDPHTLTNSTHDTTEATAKHTDHSTRESHTQGTIDKSHSSGHIKTGDPLNDLTLAASDSEVAGLVEGQGREGKGESLRERKDREGGGVVDEMEEEGGESGVVKRGGRKVLSQRERELVCLVLDGALKCKNRDSLEKCLRWVACCPVHYSYCFLFSSAFSL